MLFSGLGARLWFLQTVEAESLQQVVDQRNTEHRADRPRAGTDLRPRRPAARRQRADLQRRRRLGGDASRRRPGRPVQPPVGLGRRAGRGDGGALRLRRLRHAAAAADRRGRPRGRRHRPQRAQRGLPRRHDGQVVPPGVPYAPLAAHVVGYMGAITDEDVAHYEALGLRHVEPRRGGRPRRRRAGIRDDAARPVGRDRLRGRLARQRRPRDQPHGRRSTGWTSSCRSTSTCSSTPSGCCRPSCG